LLICAGAEPRGPSVQGREHDALRHFRKGKKRSGAYIEISRFEVFR